LNAVKGNNRDRRQNPNYHDYDQQFDDRKSIPGLLGMCH